MSRPKALTMRALQPADDAAERVAQAVGRRNLAALRATGASL
jgi:hypothetical protein